MMPSILPLAPRCGTGHLERSDFRGDRLQLQQMSTHSNKLPVEREFRVRPTGEEGSKSMQVSSHGLALASQPCRAI
jgi:hypothetical protein